MRCKYVGVKIRKFAVADYLYRIDESTSRRDADARVVDSDASSSDLLVHPCEHSIYCESVSLGLIELSHLVNPSSKGTNRCQPWPRRNLGTVRTLLAASVVAIIVMSSRPSSFWCTVGLRIAHAIWYFSVRLCRLFVKLCDLDPPSLANVEDVILLDKSYHEPKTSCIAPSKFSGRDVRKIGYQTNL